MTVSDAEFAVIQRMDRYIFPWTLWQAYYSQLVGRPITIEEVHEIQDRLNHVKTAP